MIKEKDAQKGSLKLKVKIILNYKCHQQIHLNLLSVLHHSGTTIVIKYISLISGQLLKVFQ